MLPKLTPKGFNEFMQAVSDDKINFDKIKTHLDRENPHLARSIILTAQTYEEGDEEYRESNPKELPFNKYSFIQGALQVYAALVYQDSATDLLK